MLPPVALKKAAELLANVPSACGALVARLAADCPKQLGGSDAPANDWAQTPSDTATVTTTIEVIFLMVDDLSRRLPSLRAEPFTDPGVRTSSRRRRACLGIGEGERLGDVLQRDAFGVHAEEQCHDPTERHHAGADVEAHRDLAPSPRFGLGAARRVRALATALVTRQ
jgi:hypothetical protein